MENLDRWRGIAHSELVVDALSGLIIRYDVHSVFGKEFRVNDEGLAILDHAWNQDALDSEKRSGILWFAVYPLAEALSMCTASLVQLCRCICATRTETKS
jgi:hypothetical protein